MNCPCLVGVLPSPEYFGHQQEQEVRAGDLLLIFTDGLVEIANAKGEEFGWPRLQGVVERNRNQSLKRISDAILEAGIRWGKPTDDRILLLIRFR